MNGDDKPSGSGAFSTDPTIPPRTGAPKTGRVTVPRSLRERAEEELIRLKTNHPADEVAPLPVEDIGKTLHELQVHQIELQVQNEELRRNQAELEAARNRYFNFYDQAPVGYCTVNKQGLIIQANLTIAGLLGVERGALMMRPFSHFIDGEFRDTYYLHRKKLTESGEPQSCELRMVKQDGSLFWTNLETIATTNSDNAPVCRMVITDITERKQAEETLRNLSTYNRSLIEANLDPLVTIDYDGKIADANAATEMVTGYLRRELIGTDFSDYFTEPEKARQGYERAFREGLIRDYPLEIRHHDGHITSVLYNATVYRDDYGNIRGVFASARDITERRKAEEELRETNALLSLFLKYSPIYSFIKEVNPEESRVLMASENFQEMLGIQASAMVGMTMTDLFPAEFAAKMTKDDWDVVSNGKMITLEETVNGRDYTTIKFPVSLGERHLLAGYAIDITERKRTEDEKSRLAALNRQLQKAESLSRMAGAIAHHFNNKLHVVMGNLELAREGLARGETSTSNLTAAMLAADQAVEVSKMLLVYLGQVTGKQEPLDLSEVCRNALSTLQAVVPKAVKIETDLPSPGPAVKANAKQIQQILSNLVTNAWESADDAQQCTIHLRTGTVSPADIPTSHRFPIQWQPCRDSYACLEVRDNGCGITEEALDEIFSPFFSTKFTGRGLGLPMVLGLVQAHGGGVTVESTPGHGSVFRVFLPISTEIVSRPAIAADKAAEIRQTGTVLLVDDEDIVVDITSRMLSMLGFTVLSAGDGLEALELFRQHRADIRLVLSDVSMPRMNGLETLAALRKIDPDIPVILASGYSEEQVMDGTHPERPQAFLGKPYGFDALRDAIRLSLTNTGVLEASGGAPPKDAAPEAQGGTQ